MRSMKIVKIVELRPKGNDLRCECPYCGRPTVVLKEKDEEHGRFQRRPNWPYCEHFEYGYQNGLILLPNGQLRKRLAACFVNRKSKGEQE